MEYSNSNTKDIESEEKTRWVYWMKIADPKISNNCTLFLGLQTSFLVRKIYSVISPSPAEVIIDICNTKIRNYLQICHLQYFVKRRELFCS
jgi:hypothetical protein